MASTNYKIAFTYLSSRLKQTIVAVLSVTFGISMYVFMNSFMNGVNDTQTDMAFSSLAHIWVYNDRPKDRTNLLVGKTELNEVVHLRNPKVIPYIEGIKSSEQYIDLLEQHSAVSAVAPEVNLNVFFQNGALKVNGRIAGEPW